jgi:hypothetical protein
MSDLSNLLGSAKNSTKSSIPAVCYFAKCKGENRKEYLALLNIPEHTQDTEVGRIMFRLALAAIRAKLEPVKD